MSSTAVATVSGATVIATTVSRATVIAGRTDVTARALERMVAAIAASRLRVPFSDVIVRLSDEQGALGISIAAPVRLPSLAESAASGVRIITDGQRARAEIRDSVIVSTGRAVGTLSIRLTRAVVQHERRVK